MKKLILLLSILGLITTVATAQLSTGYYPPATPYYANSITLASFSGAVTNSATVVGSTNRVDANLYHTVQAWCSTTNQFSITIEGSLDTTSWTQCAAINVVTNAVGNGLTTFTGKYGYIRLKATGTGVTGGVTYLGGR